jgi:hypothetical protein
MSGNVLPIRRKARPLCPDFESDCLTLPFCDAWQCAVDLRHGLTGELAHCPMCGVSAVATYRLSPSRARHHAS